MESDVTRREALVLGGTLLAASLAGCTGGGGDGGDGSGDGGDDGGDGGDGSGDGGGDGGAGNEVTVGQVATAGPLRMLIDRVERLAVAPVLGLQLRAQEGNTYLAPTVTLKNESDRYLALAFDAMSVRVGEASYESSEPYVDIYSPEIGGLPLAPGEVTTFRTYFEVPDGQGNGRLLLGTRTRSLPDGFGSRTFTVVDLDATATSPASLAQSLRDEPLAVGETASFDGLTATLQSVSYPAAVDDEPPADGSEFVALSLSVTHGAGIPNGIFAGIGGFGGMELRDDAGREFEETVRFRGELGGSRRYDASGGIQPGETREGVAVVVVPSGVEPLYLAWTPPANFWTEGTGARANRAVWRLR